MEDKQFKYHRIDPDPVEDIQELTKLVVRYTLLGTFIFIVAVIFLWQRRYIYSIMLNILFYISMSRGSYYHGKIQEIENKGE